MAENLPYGLENSLENAQLPDLDTTFQLSSAHFRRVEPIWRYPKHDHAFFELNYQVEGLQVMTLNGKEVIHRPGEIFLISPFDPHSTHVIGNENMAYYCLHFEVDDPLLRRLMCLSGSRHYAADSVLATRLTPTLEKLIAYTRQQTQQPVVARLQILSSVFELLAALGLSLSENLDQTPQLHPAVLNFATALAARIERQITTQSELEGIETMIELLGYSPAHGNAIFHKVYGMAPRDYRSTLKLKRAKLLLMNVDLSIERVAEQMGYSELAHFSRQFKRWSGLSPLQYRKLASSEGGI